MKKLFTTTIALAAIMTANAQLTLTSANTPHTAPYDDIRHLFDSAAFPQHGNNVEFDYSGLPPASPVTVKYNPVTRAGFDGYTRFSMGMAFLGNIPLYSEYYSHKDANGVFRIGSYKLPQSVGVGSLSGNATDTISFPGNNSIFANPGYLIKFPATYGSTWSDEYVYEVDYNITVAAFGLNNTPGQRKQYCTQTDTVVGSGNLILPAGNGVSLPIQVILVKRSIFYLDSTFLNGSPAPPALLNAFGLTQGSTSVQNVYSFYAADFERPVLQFEMSADWKSIVTSLNNTYYTSTGIEQNLNINNLSTIVSKVYPNPVKSGEILNISLNNNHPISEFRLLSIEGKEVFYQNMQSSNDDQLAIQLPHSISKGTYVYQLIDKNGMVVSVNKLIVTE